MNTKKGNKMGVGGRCICPKCNHAMSHQAGVRCQEERCPQCGCKMLREGSVHHTMLLQKKGLA